MSTRILLREICHGRSGDKGPDVNVGIAVYDPVHFQWVKDHFTATVVAKYLKQVTDGPVTRYELPRLGALNFMIRNGLGGGSTKSLVVDGFGKNFSQILLDMEVEAPPGYSASHSEVPRGPAEGGSRPAQTLPARQSVAAGRKKVVRLGSGSAHARDHLEPALALAASGEVDYLVFDCLSERMALKDHLSKSKGGLAWDPYLERRMRKIIPACAATGTKLITNMGSADPYGAAKFTVRLCTELGLQHLRVMVVLGDDVLELVREEDLPVEETGEPVSSFGDRLISANAYIGAQPIVEALRLGADIIVCGRVGDSTQFLAPLIYEFGWPANDWNLLGKGLGIGHLLECAAQLTGGIFADPPYKVVPDLHRVGFPFAAVSANGEAVISKLPGTGGVINRMTCLEQLLYEIGDPADYKHTDAIVDFTTTEITQIGPDLVRITGTTGHPKPASVKVSVGVHEGFVGVGRTMFGGSTALERAQLGADVVARRLAIQGMDASNVRFDLEGVSAIFPWKRGEARPPEVVLRVAGHCKTREEADLIFNTVGELPCNGPTGSSWGRDPDGGGVEEIPGMYVTFVPQEAIKGEVIEVSSPVGSPNP